MEDLKKEDPFENREFYKRENRYLSISKMRSVFVTMETD